MSIQFTEQELTKHSEAGNTIVVAYRHAYEIRYSTAQRRHYVAPIMGSATGLPYTKRGRFACVTPEHFRKMQLNG